VNLFFAIGVIAAGGALGSVMRYLISIWFLDRLGPGFPWGTFTINVTGSFLIGVVLGMAAARAGFSPYLRLFLATGLLGGYTTFSTFSYEGLNLFSDALTSTAILYVVASVVLGIIGCLAGISAARSFAH
jgi:CrcB protein